MQDFGVQQKNYGMLLIHNKKYHLKYMEPVCLRFIVSVIMTTMITKLQDILFQVAYVYVVFYVYVDDLAQNDYTKSECRLRKLASVSSSYRELLAIQR
jgi:hypothetical protein